MVARSRGIRFEDWGSNSVGPRFPDDLAAFKALRQVAVWLGFTDIGTYVGALDEEGPFVFERCPEAVRLIDGLRRREGPRTTK